MTQKPTELADYFDIFGVEPGLPTPVVVGGQAAPHAMKFCQKFFLIDKTVRTSDQTVP
jgi:hypothetical protein